MAELTDARIADLLLRLEEAIGATGGRRHEYVEPRQGLLAQASARRNHFIVGRRGAGKSSLLHEIGLQVRLSRGVAVELDLEQFRGATLSDKYLRIVANLLQVLADEIALLDESLRWGKPYADRHGLYTRLTLRQRHHYRKSYRVASAAIRTQLARLDELIGRPEELTLVVVGAVRVERSRRGTIRLGGRRQSDPIYATAEGTHSRQSTTEQRTEGNAVQQKLDLARSLTSGLRDAIELALNTIGDGGAFLLLDDFQKVPIEEQPELLQRLHELEKGLDLHLKIAAVRNQIVAYIDAGPGTGIQLGHDAGELNLDISLEQFTHALHLLDEILRGVCEGIGVPTGELLGEETRATLVVLSGAVPRDYIYLITLALRHASEKSAHRVGEAVLINPDDLRYAYEQLGDLKRRELLASARSSPTALYDMYDQIVQFCVEQRCNSVLVEYRNLDSTGWGRDVERLCELRLLHPAGTAAMSFGGQLKEYRAFVVDLSPQLIADIGENVDLGNDKEVTWHVFVPMAALGEGPTADPQPRLS